MTSWERLFTLSFSPVSCFGALCFFTMAVSWGWACCGSACPWPGSAPPMWPYWACHCSCCHLCHSSSLHCGSSTNSSSGPVMCSTIPRAMDSPCVSPSSRKMVRALFTTASALLMLPLMRCTSDSMSMAPAMFSWSSISLKSDMASSTARKAWSACMAAVWSWATVQKTEARSFLLPDFLASATASPANSSASAQSCAKSGSILASGTSPRP
mmetsp:Transcript_13622/g.40728  ORF Transcript_13622/g.40728 Transcript_13622/m.40728 type:complete len:212 (-) Transcript_13622:1613-2248(-)